MYIYACACIIDIHKFKNSQIYSQIYLKAVSFQGLLFAWQFGYKHKQLATALRSTELKIPYIVVNRDSFC